MRLKKIIYCLFSGLIFSINSEACTTLAIADTQGNIYHGRTLEYMQDLPSWFTYYPVGTNFQQKNPDGGKGLKYKAKYSIIAITSPVYDDDSRDILEGMNSAGLSFSENMIITNDLLPPPASDYYKSLPVTSIGEWALANFATVNELKEAIVKTTFWSPVLSNFGNLKSPFHYAFYDKKGGSIVVEVLNGKLHAYDNPTRVMTNGPEFPWHITNLNNYTHLTNVDRSSATFGGLELTQPDSGIAVSALPSSDTSVGRFIRGVYYTTFAQQPTSPHEAINTLAHIMSRFDRPKNISIDRLGSEGEGNASNQPVTEYTVWTTLSDLSKGTFFVRGYNDINYKQYSFQQFSVEKRVIYEEINKKK